MRYLTSRHPVRVLVVVGAAVAGLCLSAGVSSAAPVALGGSAAVGPMVAVGDASGGSASVQVDGLRLRGGPNLGGIVQGLLYSGDQVSLVPWAQVTGADGITWDEVTLPSDSAGGLPAGSEGWVDAAYISAPVCLPDAPVVGPAAAYC